MKTTDKIKLITEISNTVVSNELGYIPLLKDIYFEYCLLKYCSDIDLLPEEDFTIENMVRFLFDNKAESDKVKSELGQQQYDELYENVTEAILFRKNNFGGHIQELLSELLIKVSNWNIDTTEMSKVVSIMDKLNAPDLAKALLK